MIGGLAVGAPFAFGAIKVPVPDAARLNGGGRAVPAGAVAAVPAGSVPAAPAGMVQAPPCDTARQPALPPPHGTITRAMPAGSLPVPE